MGTLNTNASGALSRVKADSLIDALPIDLEDGHAVASVWFRRKK